MRALTDREWQTLTDVSNPSECLLRDGETIERLLREGLIHQLANCYRPTPLGTEALQRRQGGRAR
ncbi:hypothetical protein K32_23720 [Kaistia sp. 32K]|uniref:hypothetical protein n=1 Tax=Kaistia sp. 32K TaxID=2795690 RepID=UPI00191538B7|nr:hypothetical protein [Kaistia sp. 32K]BCP53755.1 hypothetical protein K32_23720 [Kaistia sp. 32K]